MSVKGAPGRQSHNWSCPGGIGRYHYDDDIMGAMASQITSLTIVYSTVYSGADQSKHQSSASLAFVWGIHRGPVNSPHKWPVTRKMVPFDDVIMIVPSSISRGNILAIYLFLWNECVTKQPSDLIRTMVSQFARLSHFSLYNIQDSKDENLVV